ncbi:MAG: hypothetical protein EWM51_10235 [Treponema sp.]|nr:MAG: hypothetical protein EWM51_10235 [Treponema sp.]
MKKLAHSCAAVCAAGVLAVLLFSGCEITVVEQVPVETEYSISGSVVNVRSVTQTDKPDSGSVEVRVFGSATAVATAPVAADGTYTVEGLKSGSYLVTYKDAAATPVWFGVPVSVTVGEGNVSNVGALAFKAIPVGSILLITTWTNTEYDVDSISMVDSGSSVTQVYWDNKTLSVSDGSGVTTVTLERDIKAAAITPSSYPAETTLVESLAAGTELRFYVQLQSLTGSTGSTGSITGLDAGTTSKMPAGVTVYAMYMETLTKAEHYGTWFAPLNTDEGQVAMVSMVGNDDGSLSIGSFGANFAAPNTPRSLLNVNYGVPVKEIR